MNIHTVEANRELEARAEAERVEFPNGVVRPFVLELANRGRVKAEEWAVRMSGPEREMLLPHLETEVFLQHYEHCLRNCSRRDGISYDDAVIAELSPEAIRRMREFVQAFVMREQHWEPIAQKSAELASKLRDIRTEATRLTRLLAFVINWCAERPEDEKPGPFRRDTYADGVRYAKDVMLRWVLGRLEPGRAGQEPSDGFMGRYGKFGMPVPTEVELAHASEVVEELARTRGDTTERQEERTGAFRLLGDVLDALQYEMRVIHGVATRNASEDSTRLTALIHRVQEARKALIRSVVGGGVS